MKRSIGGDRELSRRSVIVGSVAADETTLTTDALQNERKKFTIVGAGTAGLYAAWRLVQSKHADPSEICILEMTNRIGGRLDTFIFRGRRGRRATVELGGMRFNTGQKLVTKLVKHFGLKCSDFPETDNRLYYLRGKQIWQREVGRPGVLPYDLIPGEQQKTPDDLLSWAVGNAIGNPDDWNKWTPRKWQTFVEHNKYFSPTSNSVRVYNGAEYSSVGFWDLLRDQLSNEGYRYATDGGGYDSNTINWNSAIAMPYVASGDYASWMKYQRIDGGYHKLPEALGNALRKKNVPILRNTRLVRFVKDGSGMLDCTYECAGKQMQYKTQHLFLCVPRRSLELLDPETDFVIQMRRKRYFESVIKQPSFKLLFLYRDRWYRDVQIRGQSIKPFGPTITDLPLRMIWYFDPNPRKKYWALLASYCDMASTEFWSVMENAPEASGYPGSRKPTKEMVKMARAQLQSVHNIKIPNPKSGAVFQDWGLDPYGAGYHAWAAHYSPWDMFDRMLQPIPSYNVYICGEAYSLDQGWVEGALNTVDACLQKRLQIKRYVATRYIKSLSGALAPASTSFGLRRV